MVENIDNDCVRGIDWFFHFEFESTKSGKIGAPLGNCVKIITCKIIRIESYKANCKASGTVMTEIKLFDFHDLASSDISSYINFFLQFNNYSHLKDMILDDFKVIIRFKRG